MPTSWTEEGKAFGLTSPPSLNPMSGSQKKKLSVDTKIKMGVNSGQGKHWMPMISDISIPLGTPVWAGVYAAMNDPCKDPVIFSFPCLFLPVTCAVRTVRGQL